jgi:hypothetical protein
MPIEGGYIWLPLRFEAGRPVIQWHTEWNLESLNTLK